MNIELFDKYRVSELITKAVKATERGELMKELLEPINQTRHGNYKPVTMPRMGRIIQNIPTDALYTLVSKCKDSGNRAPVYNIGFSKRFWFELRPQHEK